MSQSHEPALVILSGGLDSVTLLHYATNIHESVFALTFIYGQKHQREIQSACYFAEKLLGVGHHGVIDIEEISDAFGNSTLISGQDSVPQLESINDRNPQVLAKTVAPFRNGIMLSIAVAFASSHKINYIYYGAHASDYATYPDCRPDFVNAFNYAANLGTGNNKMVIAAPFVHKKKSQIVIEGDYFGVEFRRTYSCYNGGELHCGKCPSCMERKNAFKEAGVNDPTEYYS
jgi:7-cyano-7-deazaguanine synthase